MGVGDGGEGTTEERLGDFIQAFKHRVSTRPCSTHRDTI